MTLLAGTLATKIVAAVATLLLILLIISVSILTPPLPGAHRGVTAHKHMHVPEPQPTPRAVPASAHRPPACNIVR
jgi:hypothetical protein